MRLIQSTGDCVLELVVLELVVELWCHTLYTLYEETTDLHMLLVLHKQIL